MLGLPTATLTSRTPTRAFNPGRFILALFVFFLALRAAIYLQIPNAFTEWPPVVGNQRNFADQCVQPEPLFPGEDSKLDGMYKSLLESDFRNATIRRLSGAVQVKTESFDDLGPVGKDERWAVFGAFHKYLEDTFPLIHKKLKVEKVNTYGLLYTWKGTDSSLKPTLLMAHQDTVPVAKETIDAWKYPPWSGEYDGEFIWGRGSADCKNQLIAAMETLELLLDAGFEPRRTVLLSFGFDEEISGGEGAGPLAAHVRERYGDDGVAVIVDEGSSFEEAWGTLFAKPGTAEKGYTDVTITVRMPGGHSSVPPDHTSIGVLAELVSRIEADQYRTRLSDKNPYLTQLHCGAAYSPEFPPTLRRLLGRRKPNTDDSHMCMRDELAFEAAKQGPLIKYLMQTSQAVDLVSGGAKVNALPEHAVVTINHRINVGETTQVVRNRLTALAGALAEKYKLALHAFDGGQGPSSISLAERDGHTIPVAPVTPSDASTAGPFSVLAGTVRSVYGSNVVVSPGIMTGNTDTRHYWGVTKHIFRFAPGFDPKEKLAMDSIHTINEKVSVVNHINTVRWFVMFVRNMDEADL